MVVLNDLTFLRAPTLLTRVMVAHFRSFVQVKVIEKTNEFRRFGGPIQLASNALSTIKAIDPVFFDKVMEHFTFTGVRTNGIKDGLRTEWCVTLPSARGLIGTKVKMERFGVKRAPPYLEACCIL